VTRTILRWVFVFIMCFAAQATIVPAIRVFGREPDIIFVAVFVFALRFGVTPAIWLGFAVGLLQDLYSPSILGQNALAKTISGAFCGLFNERVMSTDPIMKLVILVLAFLMHDCVVIAADMVKEGLPLMSLLSGLVLTTLPRTLFSALFAGVYYGWEYAHRRGA
jgi:rod shape-determining protein MreD